MLLTNWKLLSLTTEVWKFNYKFTIFGWVWWHTYVIAVLWQSEAGGLLEAQSSRPAWAIQRDLSLQKKIFNYLAHAYNPSTLEAKAGGSPEVRSSRPAWPIWWNPPLYIKKKNYLSLLMGKFSKFTILTKFSLSFAICLCCFHC